MARKEVARAEVARAELLSHSSCSSLKAIPSDSSTSGTSLSLDDAYYSKIQLYSSQN